MVRRRGKHLAAAPIRMSQDENLTYAVRQAVIAPLQTVLYTNC